MMAGKTDGGIPVHCAYDAMVDTDTLVGNPRNPNTHPDEQIRLLAKIIVTQGWRAPITVSKRSGFIVRGHGRLAAAKAAGLTECPVDYQDYADEAAEWADLIADNRLAELAEIDRPALKDLLETLDCGQIDMELTGFTEDALASLMSEAFYPTLDPDIGIGRTGDEDIRTAAQKLDTKFTNKRADQVEFTCPYCGETFYVNKADVLDGGVPSHDTR
jgi:ParB-like chromosome segregation protein Spo0J